jgi:hypothetical protein
MFIAGYPAEGRKNNDLHQVEEKRYNMHQILRSKESGLQPEFNHICFRKERVSGL